MFDQLFESYRKASESSFHGQQQLFKQWLQQWPAASSLTAGLPPDWANALYKRWADAMNDALNRQRELLDSSYRTGMQVVEQSMRVSEVKSPEDYRRLMEEIWQKLSETFKDQAETQVKDFQRVSERWFDVAHKAQA
jgi:hypothetical protein